MIARYQENELSTVKSVSPVALLSCAAALAGFFALSPDAAAKVTHAGTWPEADKKVTLDLSRVARDEAIRKLAEAAGWSVVVHAPATDPVDVHVKDQPADKVLDLLLLDSDYVATRDGALVSIQRASASPAGSSAPGAHDAQPAKKRAETADPVVIPEIPKVEVPAVPDVPEVPLIPAIPSFSVKVPLPPPPPAAPGSDHDSDDDDVDERGGDREVMGASLKIGKDEVVDDVSVMGGSLDVYGKVNGDISVAGGAVHIHPGAHIRGDVAAIGGDIRIEDGARVDGEVVVKGGAVHRGDKAIVGGDIRGHKRSSRSHAGHAGHPGSPGDPADPASVAPELAQSKAAEVGGAFARMALLFVLGTVLLALMPERMDNLKAELVSRPMRSLALGVVGLLGAGATFLVLCVTVVGIPFALLGAVVGAIAIAASVCAVLETVGRALLRHKSQNPYVHLAVGCFLFLAASAIPGIGKAVAVVTILAATGILVSTRLAGFIQKKSGSHPYRTAPATAS